MRFLRLLQRAVRYQCVDFFGAPEWAQRRDKPARKTGPELPDPKSRTRNWELEAREFVCLPMSTTQRISRKHSSPFRLTWFLFFISFLNVATPDRIGRTHAENKPNREVGGLGLYVRGSESLTPGTEAALRIQAHAAPSENSSFPVENVSVEVTLSGAGKHQVLARGVTDPQGNMNARFQVPLWAKGKYVLAVEASDSVQKTTQKHTVQLSAAARILLQTDKPLYQPGQTVHLRALSVRSQDGRPLQSGTIRFTVQDSRDNRIFIREQPVSMFGIAFTDVPLAEELLLGKYSARAELLGITERSATSEVSVPFEISRYVLPKIRVSVTPHKKFALPGTDVSFSIAANYFQGKPVPLAEVIIRAQIQSPHAPSPLPMVHGRLDANGKQDFRLSLPKEIQGEGQNLLVSAVVKDAANQRAETGIEFPIVTKPVQIDVVPEAGQVIPSVPNQVYVVAAYPDGSGAEQASVSFSLPHLKSRPVIAMTDPMGIATFSIEKWITGDKNLDSKGCAPHEIQTQISVTLKEGSRLEEKRCLPLRKDGGLLLRSDRAVYARGQTMELSVFVPGVKEGQCFVDVLRDKQQQEALTIPIANGHGKITHTVSDRMAGTVSLLAYVIGEDGRKWKDSRLVYVERPSALRVSAHTETEDGQMNPTLRPGQHTKLKLRVLDAQTGVGVHAALGLVMVDEALLALRPLRPGLVRTYFTLSEQARKAAEKNRVTPNGYKIDALVEKGSLTDYEQEVAKLLLAGATAPWEDGWETDPWQERITATQELTKKWGIALERYSTTHLLGERDPKQAGSFRYQVALPSLLRASGFLSASELVDPYRRPLTTEKLIEAADFPEFPEYAQFSLDRKLSAIYGALQKQVTADVKAGKRTKDVDGSVLLSDADLAGFSGFALLDPWGVRLRLHTRKRPHKVHSLLSRQVIQSAGPDGLFGTKDDLFPSDNTCFHHTCRPDSRITVVGVSASDAFSAVQMGCGCGYGSASGALGAASHRTHVVYSRTSIAEIGGLGAKKDSVRSQFPETLLYRPEVITDEKGEAVIPLQMADSITTWRLLADAVSQDGRLGSLFMGIPVIQDFFVDLDVPPLVTQHDELAIPVPVFNHLTIPQTVTLTLHSEPWFQPMGTLSETIQLSAGQSGVRFFKIKAMQVGKQVLKVSAKGSSVSDAVERPVQVFPDGIEQLVSAQERLAGPSVSHDLSLPAMTIPGTSELMLKLYPAPTSHVVEGLDSLLRMPHGCFEQTSSTTYPNALILQYLRKTRRNTPSIERKALEYLQTGYQKLLSFEVPGGGFSWFGNAPAHKVLTAYGLEEFADMSLVLSIDPKVLARTQKWLASQQKTDGSFDPDHSGIREGAINAITDDTLRTTTYVALAIAKTDSKGMYKSVVEKAREYARKRLAEKIPSDAYTLSLVAEFLGPRFVPKTASGFSGSPLVEKLWSLHKVDRDGRSVFFSPETTTPTFGKGKSATIETTALAATALHLGDQRSRSGQALSYLVSAKDSFGTWHSTQATIRSLKTLLLLQEVEQSTATGRVEVFLDGSKFTTLELSKKEDSMRLVSFPSPSLGKHKVELRYTGTGVLDYQLVLRYYTPHMKNSDTPKQPSMAVGNAPLSMRVELSATALTVDEMLVQHVFLKAGEEVMMPLVQVGVPPGFTVEKPVLDGWVAEGRIEKYEVSTRSVNLYLRRLGANEERKLSVSMTALNPGRVQIPQTTAYPYYEPEQTIQTEPMMITVTEPKPETTPFR